MYITHMYIYINTYCVMGLRRLIKKHQILPEDGLVVHERKRFLLKNRVVLHMGNMFQLQVDGLSGSRRVSSGYIWMDHPN